MAGFAAPVSLVVVNIYICRELFRIEYLKWMGSIEGAFVSISRFIAANWSDLGWYPLWYGGVPFQNTYPPLLHMLVAAVAAAGQISPARSYHICTAAFFCAGPVAVYLLVTSFTESRWSGFWAGLGYSVLSPSAFLMPSVRNDLGTLWASRRLHLLLLYGEGPHLTSLFFLPLAILALFHAILKRSPLSCLFAALLFDLVALSNWLGAFALALAIIALVLVYARRPSQWAVVMVSVGLAYALVMPWIPPSTVQTIRINAQQVAGDFSQVYQRMPLYLGSGTAVLLTMLYAFHRLRLSPTAQFAMVLGLLLSSVPLAAEWMGIYVVPQPWRYQIELDLITFTTLPIGLHRLFRKWPGEKKVAISLLASLFAMTLLVLDRRDARGYLKDVDIRQTIEYQTAKWLDTHSRGRRVLVPGSISFWLNAFTDTPQMEGGFDQGVANYFLAIPRYQLHSGVGGAEPTILWLQAFGVEMVMAGGPSSREVYQPFLHAERFASSLNPIWRNGDDVIYEVPGMNGLAHVIPASDIVRIPPRNGLDLTTVLKYDSAITNIHAPPSHFAWTSHHSARIEATIPLGDLISVQVSYHPGWHAKIRDSHEKLKLWKDGLGQMVVEPNCFGPCVVELAYDGGTEAKLARAIQFFALVLIAVYVLWSPGSFRLLGTRQSPNQQ